MYLFKISVHIFGKVRMARRSSMHHWIPLDFIGNKEVHKRLKWITAHLDRPWLYVKFFSGNISSLKGSNYFLNTSSPLNKIWNHFIEIACTWFLFCINRFSFVRSFSIKQILIALWYNMALIYWYSIYWT